VLPPGLPADALQPQPQSAPHLSLADALAGLQPHELPQLHLGAQLQGLHLHSVVIGTSWVSGC
jgi:hypothetical protein